METSFVFSDRFEIEFDESTERILIWGIKDGRKPLAPIAIKLDTLESMGSEAAGKFFGETILLLVPRVRERLYGLKS